MECSLSKSADSFLLKAQKFSPRRPRCFPKKIFPVKKICFLSKYSFEHVNYRFEDPAKSSSQNVIDYFASCPKKWRIYSFKNNYHFAKCSFGQVESSFENPADRFLSHSGKNFRQNQKKIMKLSLFCKRLFLKNSFSTYRKQFWPTCRNVRLKTWNFFAQSPRKIMNLPFPKKKCFLWTPKRQFRQPCWKVSASCLNFPLRLQDQYWCHQFFENLWFSPKSLITFRSMTRKDTQIDYFFAFFCT